MLFLRYCDVRFKAAAFQFFLLHFLPLQLMSLLLQLFLLQLPFIDGRINRATIFASVGRWNSTD